MSEVLIAFDRGEEEGSEEDLSMHVTWVEWEVLYTCLAVTNAERHAW